MADPDKVYSVTASPAVTSLLGGKGTRRRGGLVFGSRPVVVSTATGPGVAEVVSPASLEAILGDAYLNSREVEVEIAKPKDGPEQVKVVSTAEAKRRATTRRKKGKS